MPEIEITQQMIDAGVEAYYQLDREFDADSRIADGGTPWPRPPSLNCEDIIMVEPPPDQTPTEILQRVQSILNHLQNQRQHNAPVTKWAIDELNIVVDDLQAM